MSIKISALPEITSYEYGDVLPIVDDLATQTSKITMGNLFNNTPARISDLSSLAHTNTFISAGSDVNSSGVDSVFRNGAKYSVVMAGTGYIDNSNDSSIVSSTAGASQVNINDSSATAIIGGFRSTISNTTRSSIISSQDTTISNGFNSNIIGCEGGTTSNAYKSHLIGNASSNINNSTEALISNSRNSSIDLAGGNSGTIIGSKSSSISLPSPVAEINGIYSSDSSTINTSGIQSVIINSKSSGVGGSIQGATMVSTDTQNAVFDWTLHTDNIHTYKVNSTEWRNGGDVSGAISVDLSTGNLFSFRITGDLTSVQLNNARLGGEYEFWVENSGSFTITTINLDGNANSVFSAAGSLNPTNNGFTFYRLRIVDDGSGNKRGVMKEFLNYSAI